MKNKGTLIFHFDMKVQNTVALNFIHGKDLFPSLASIFTYIYICTPTQTHQTIST